MKEKICGTCAVALVMPTENTQLCMIVDGCKVKMNFPSESEKSAVSDIKRMMLGGAFKTRKLYITITKVRY